MMAPVKKTWLAWAVCLVLLAVFAEAAVRSKFFPPPAASAAEDPQPTSDGELDVQALADELERTWPQVQSKITEQVAGLKEETTGESLAALSNVDAFFWPGAPLYHNRVFSCIWPLEPEVGLADAQVICSNRRFLKLYEELARLPRAEAAELVNGQLKAALAVYDDLFEAYVGHWGPDYPPTREPASPPVQISSNSDGSPTLLGARLQVLSLLLLAGNLELEETAASVLAAAEAACRQRERFYAKDEFSETFRYEMLVRSSLYNRPILGCALVRTAAPRAGQDPIDELGLQMKTEKLTAYDALTTPYDLHARMGAVPIDYSAGVQLVEYLPNVSDEQFQSILAFAKQQRPQ